MACLAPEDHDDLPGWRASDRRSTEIMASTLARDTRSHSNCHGQSQSSMPCGQRGNSTRSRLTIPSTTCAFIVRTPRCFNVAGNGLDCARSFCVGGVSYSSPLVLRRK